MKFVFCVFFLVLTIQLNSGFAEDCVTTECQNARDRNAKCMPLHFKNWVEGKFTLEQRSTDATGCPKNYEKFKCCLVPKVTEECIITDCQNTLTRNTKCMPRHFQLQVSAEAFRIEMKGSDPGSCKTNFAKYTCCLVPRGETEED